MDRLRKVLFLSEHNFKKWAVNPRMYVLLILLVGYIHSMVSPIASFCASFEYTVGPWLFPFLMSEPYSLLMIMLGLVLLFCDAPFIDSEQPYLILRSGRKLWTAGQILYIVVASAVYFFVVCLLTILPLAPYISLESGWGKVINTFCQTEIAYQHGIAVPFDYSISNTLEPIQAMLLEFLLCWLIGVFMGLLLFLLNLTVNRSTGAICTSALAIFPLFVNRTDWRLHHISPVSWASLSVVDLQGATAFPSLGYALGVLGGGIVLFSLLLVFAMRRRDIDIVKSV